MSAHPRILSWSLSDPFADHLLLRILDAHHKTIIILGSFAITTSGWWAWQLFLSGAYSTDAPTPYAVKHGFISVFGPDPAWWLTLIVVLSTLAVAETAYRALQRTLLARGFWRWGARHSEQTAEELGVEVWQEMEKDPAVRAMLKSRAATGC